MILDILFYAVLTYYFDHVSEGNRGRQYNKLFFLEKQYWFGSKKVTQHNNNNDKTVQDNQNNIPVNNEIDLNSI